MKIAVVGMNYRTAPISLRDRVAIAPEQMKETLQGLLRKINAAEGAIIFTCNRLELYVLASDAVVKAGALEEFLTSYSGISLDELLPHIYRHEDRAAVAHLFAVTASLDSMVVGEAQITGQVRAAYELAASCGAAGKFFHRLFQHALHTAKKVRTHTEIGEGQVSVGSVAVLFAERVFRDLSQRSVLLVGAGEMSELALQNLRAAGVRTIRVANRTPARALELAAKYGGEAWPFERLPDGLAESDIVICSTGAPYMVIGKEEVAEAVRRRSDRPILLIDLAVPRNIAPEVAELAGVYLSNIDDLKQLAEEAAQRRERERERAYAIVEAEASDYMRWLAAAQAASTITDLRKWAELLAHEELERFANKMPNMEETTRGDVLKIARQMADRLVNKLLHPPMSALRKIAASAPPMPNGEKSGALRFIRELFRLDEHPGLKNQKTD